MTTIIKIIIATLLSLLLSSCNFDFHSGVRGNGNVQIEERTRNKPFSAIEATEGLDVYLTQGNETSIIVEADENLHELILTEIENGVLKIHTKENIGQASSKKVMVSFKDVSRIESSSGSSVEATHTINSEQLELNTSSGSTMNLNLITSSLKCNSSSGSTLKLSGTTNNLTAKSASGSNISAGDLTAISSNVQASSGSGITVNTTKELTASASSGASISYYGTPEKVNKSKSSGGSVTKN